MTALGPIDGLMIVQPEILNGRTCSDELICDELLKIGGWKTLLDGSFNGPSKSDDFLKACNELMTDSLVKLSGE